MRLVEPLVKAYLALWLVAKGANNITLSVDGAEPNPGSVRDTLTRAGYVWRPEPQSSVAWTGRYDAAGRGAIRVVSRPGFDLDALFPDGKRCVAECKGEPTSSGVKAGFELTNFYTALGQLIMSFGALDPAPEWKIVAMPRTPRLTEIVRKALANRSIRDLGIHFVLVDEQGHVTEANQDKIDV